MYIQITDKCNMTCGHCCFNCGPSGRFMKKTTFMAALEIANEYGEYIAIGGGEPTLHPKFWEFLGMAMYKNSSDVPVWLATNGSNKMISIALAGMARTGAISCTLSQDEFHDDIDPEVIQAFTKQKYGNESNDFREIRNTSKNGSLVKAGRAKKLKNYELNIDCPCKGMFVDPLGKIFHCGCKTIQYGTVLKPRFPSNYTEPNEFGDLLSETCATYK